MPVATAGVRRKRQLPPSARTTVAHYADTTSTEAVPGLSCRALREHIHAALDARRTSIAAIIEQALAKWWERHT